MAEVSEALWADIERNPPSFGRLNASRVESGTNLLLAIDHDGFRHVLLLLGDAEQAFADDKSRGLAVRGRGLEVEGVPERPFLDVACTDRGGYDAFNLVVSEILRHLADGATPATAVMTTLARWRRFWGSGPHSGMTRDQLVGLFGEMWFLLVWLLPHGTEGVRRWVGPTGARHDFQWPNFSVEAKTTESIRGHLHRINGLDQLDPPENGALHLFSLRVREESGSSNSVVTLANGIENLLAGEPAIMDLFEERLAQTGYSRIHAERYSELRFRVVGERLYRVDGGFPRLSAASFTTGLPQGVERVEYEINLETCPRLCVGSSPDSPGVNF